MFKVYNGETTKEELELRKVCTNKFEEYLTKDEKVVVLDADLMGSLGSGSLVEKYKGRYNGSSRNFLCSRSFKSRA